MADEFEDESGIEVEQDRLSIGNDADDDEDTVSEVEEKKPKKKAKKKKTEIVSKIGTIDMENNLAALVKRYAKQEKNFNAFVKAIRNLISGIAKAKKIKATSDTYKRLYVDVLLDIASIFRSNKLTKAIKIIKEKAVVWKHPSFVEIERRQQETDKYMFNPIQVQKSVIECPMCHQFKTISWERQTRSADEPMTIFFSCTVESCGHRGRLY